MPETLSSAERAFLRRIQRKLDFRQCVSLSEIRAEDMPAFNSLCARKLLVSHGDYHCRVTPEALNALAAAVELAKQRAEEEQRRYAQDQREDKRQRKDARRSWVQFWFGLALGWILGGVSSAPLWAWLQSFFTQ